MKKDRTILVTNDDGINAPGLKALIDVAKDFGELFLIAPDSPQSGKGHAISVHEPIYVSQVEISDVKTAYKSSGTPADCVKLALNKLMDCSPDICLAGINHGSNSSISVIYSGTMGAAIEAGIDGIPAIGFSLLDWSQEAELETAKIYVRKILETIFDNDIPQNTLLNVNIPVADLAEINGIKICRQAKGRWIEEFETKHDENNNEYYWLTGFYQNKDDEADTDEHMLERNYVTIVPVQFDMTDYKALEDLKNLNFES
ncbi:MAG: 5'/3'-nucleotidase SurE [Bacteroidia bacterium]|nr:5'/3'-nucleotidase SurE [Bacteroidia bacterium]